MAEPGIRIGEDGKKYDTLGLEISDNSFKLNVTKSFVQIFLETLEANPSLGMAGILFLISIIYFLAVFESLTMFHYLATLISIFFMFWISLADDARIAYKFISMGLIFMAIIVFLSI